MQATLYHCLIHGTLTEVGTQQTHSLGFYHLVPNSTAKSKHIAILHEQPNLYP